MTNETKIVEELLTVVEGALDSYRKMSHLLHEAATNLNDKMTRIKELTNVDTQTTR
jgi:hypothetical protein